MSNLVVLMGDETSMWNRQQMAWIEFCCRKYRDSLMDPDVLDEFVGSDFGGIPIILLFGDCHQLAPVIGFSHLTCTRGKMNHVMNMEDW